LANEWIIAMQFDKETSKKIGAIFDEKDDDVDTLMKIVGASKEEILAFMDESGLSDDEEAERFLRMIAGEPEGLLGLSE